MDTARSARPELINLQTRRPHIHSSVILVTFDKLYTAHPDERLGRPHAWPTLGAGDSDCVQGQRGPHSQPPQSSGKPRSRCVPYYRMCSADTLLVGLQHVIESSLSDLTVCASLIAHLGVLSPNETLDDINTRDLRAILVDALRAELTLLLKTKTPKERLSNLTKATVRPPPLPSHIAPSQPRTCTVPPFSPSPARCPYSCG